MSINNQKLFSGEKLFHLHGGISGKTPIGNNTQDFDRELACIFNELPAGSVCKIEPAKHIFQSNEEA